MTVTTLQAAPLARSYVAVRGPDATAYLNRMVSNDVEALAPGESCEALLLTPRARIVAPLVVVRRGGDDFLLPTEPLAGERLVRELPRARFAAKCAIEPEEHRSVVLVGGGADVRAAHGTLALRNLDYGLPAVELIDTEPPSGAGAVSEEELER